MENNKNRYVFVFEYDGAWQIVCYENNRVKKSFSVDEDMWDDADEYVDLFLENGGNQYCYDLPSYDYLDDVNIFYLDDEPIEELSEYLVGYNVIDNHGKKSK